MTIFHGKIHYKGPFSIAMLVYQRVTTVSQSNSVIIGFTRDDCWNFLASHVAQLCRQRRHGGIHLHWYSGPAGDGAKIFNHKMRMYHDVSSKKMIEKCQPYPEWDRKISFSRNSMLKLSVTKHLLGLSEKLRHLLPHFDHATEAAEGYPVSDRFGVSTRSCPPKRKLHWKPCALPWWLPAWTLNLGGLGDQLWPFWRRNDLRWDDTKNRTVWAISHVLVVDLVILHG